MVDHHVDRPQVEAGQPVQPSGPNRSNAASAPSPKHAVGSSRPKADSPPQKAACRGQMTDDRGQKMTSPGHRAGASLLIPVFPLASAPCSQASRLGQAQQDPSSDRPSGPGRSGGLRPDLTSVICHLSSVICPPDHQADDRTRPRSPGRSGGLRRPLALGSMSQGRRSDI